MTQLTPVIYKSVGAVLDKAGIEYTFMDRDGGICCGRPLILAGRNEQAQEMIRKNTELIRQSGATHPAAILSHLLQGLPRELRPQGYTHSPLY